MKKHKIKELWVIFWTALVLFTVFSIHKTEAKELTIGVNGRIRSYSEDPVYFKEQIAILKDSTEKDRITIVISSEGGSISTANTLIRAIKEAKGHTRVLVFGYAASAAAAIALSADEFRYVLPSKILFHALKYNFDGRIELAPMKIRALWLHYYEELAGVVLFTGEELGKMLDYGDIEISGEELTKRLQQGHSRLVKYTSDDPHDYD